MTTSELAYEETRARLDALLGERASIAVYHVSGAKFAGMIGMLRAAEPCQYELLDVDPDGAAVYYVDGGQEQGQLPFFFINRVEHLVLEPDGPESRALAWANGNTITAVNPED